MAGELHGCAIAVPADGQPCLEEVKGACTINGNVVERRPK